MQRLCDEWKQGPPGFWSRPAEAPARERGLQNLLAEAQALRAELALHDGDESDAIRARDEAVRIYTICGNQLAADRARTIG